MDLTKLTIEELKYIINNAERIIRKKEFEVRNNREEQSRTTLKVGDIVTLSSNRFKGEMWEVLKLNAKRVQCQRENGEVWNIPYANIIMK